MRVLMAQPIKLFISVGEESADLHASKLCEELKQRQPNIELFGFGGGKMKKAGVDILYPLPDLALIGFVEVIKHLPSVFHVKKLALQAWEERKPDAVLLVDYPGFHFRLAEEAAKRGIPVYYFIAPQVWAWRESRIEKMRKWLKHLYVIFPFEEAYFQRHGLPCTYVGHPLLDRIPQPDPNTQFDAARLQNPRIGLLPGSRKNELNHLLPAMLKAAAILREKKPNARFLLPLADTMDEAYLNRFEIPSWIEVCRDTHYQRRRQIDFAWTASGTATVENALLGIPMAVVYRTNPINIAIGRRLIRIAYIGMVNLIAEKGICPEFIQEQCQPALLARYADALLSSSERYREMLADLKRVREKMGEEQASRKTARLLLQHMQAPQEEASSGR
ncbi:lipid-A-disaccharide synthase [bacterium]|nr:lipid-A-disaccharide synthase [bacterium]